MTKWRERILRSPLLEDFDERPRVEFRPPATEEALIEVQNQLCVTLPDELKELLRETDGVLLELAGDCSEPLILSCEGLIETNVLFRHPSLAATYMPLDCLLFFSATLGGDYRGFRILAGHVDECVYQWSHDDDGRTKVAWSLQVLIEKGEYCPY